MTLRPDIQKVLVIPPGVGHIFRGLEEIYTVNAFCNYLPEPNAWLSGASPWSISSDTINIPRHFVHSDIPKLFCNKLEASDRFYQLTCESIASKLDGHLHEYPLIERVHFADGSSKLLRVSKSSPIISSIPAFDLIPNMDGVGWKRRIAVVGGSGLDTGYTVFLSRRNINFFDSGQDDEHIGDLSEPAKSNTLLTLFGGEDETLKLEIAALGSSAKTLIIGPSPYRDLVIPAGIAWRVSGIARVIVAKVTSEDETAALHNF